MQFMMLVKSSKDCEAGQRPSDEVITAVGNYTQELRKAGVLVELSRLHPSSKAARVKVSRGAQMVSDGPFAETKELIGGYWIIDVNSLEDAIKWAKCVPFLNAENDEIEIEIRQFLEVEYFTPIKANERAVERGKGLAKTTKPS